MTASFRGILVVMAKTELGQSTNGRAFARTRTNSTARTSERREAAQARAVCWLLAPEVNDPNDRMKRR